MSVIDFEWYKNRIKNTEQPDKKDFDEVFRMGITYGTLTRKQKKELEKMLKEILTGDNID